MSARAARSVFVTGGTGFVGRAVLERLAASGTESIVCLARRPPSAPAGDNRIRYIQGDLDDPSSYSEALAGCDTVVHLAAATGSASESELVRVNVQGTERLLAACKAQQVRRFVYMSSIAAGYPELADYPYGRTKLEAERLVTASGLAYVILRPTIVLGAGSPIWQTLRKLACLPVVPLFGGGRARVQPVDVTDVARAVELLVGGYESDGAVIPIGGPEALSFAQFLQRIRTACGLRPAPQLPVPMWPVRTLIRIARAVLGERFPISAGQLSPFVQDGTAAPNELLRQLQPSMLPLDTLLSGLARASTHSAPRHDAELERECRTFTRYLIGEAPDAYVLRKYIEGHAAVSCEPQNATPIDLKLIQFAAGGPIRARIADAYARIFRPYGLLRRKLIYTFAILENSAAYHRRFTSGGSGARWLALPRIGIAITAFMLSLAAGIVLFAPRQFLARTADSEVRA
jgi:nucleoside-diphosphate-sugar epimerase